MENIIGSLCAPKCFCTLKRSDKWKPFSIKVQMFILDKVHLFSGFVNSCSPFNKHSPNWIQKLILLYFFPFSFSFLLFSLISFYLQRSNIEKSLKYFGFFLFFVSFNSKRSDCLLLDPQLLCIWTDSESASVQHSNYAIGTIYFLPPAALLKFSF